MTRFDDRARKAARAVREQLTDTTPPVVPGGRRTRHPARRWLVPSAAAVLVAGLVVTVPGVVGGNPGLPGAMSAAAAARLQPFGDCDDALGYFREHGTDYLIQRAGRGGSTGGGVERMPAAPAPTQDRTSAAPKHSDTNVQEAGVDEPDLVKTDGRRVVAVARGRVHLIEVSNGRMTRRATLPVRNVDNVFLVGNRVLVFSRAVASDGGWSAERAVLATYDITKLDAPVAVATLTVEGSVLDARLVGTQVRVATSSSPDLDIPSPVYDDQGQVSQASKDQLRAAVARTTVEDWLPTYTLKVGSAGPVSTGLLVSCPDLSRPNAFSGLDTVAVSAFDIGARFADRRAAGVVAGGQQLYASDTSTYITSTDWNRDAPTVTTSVHKFVTEPSGATAYQGSGAVRGALLNQYAMSENRGILRVASTISERRGWASQRMVNEGAVTTLAEQGGELRQLGQVDGLGREDNESIQAVRFVGDRAYVVTFRRTDPLYVVDLSNPAAPAVVGELKIPGYSGYLHPIAEDLLLGVGQSGGGGQASGVQFSLFDIGDPARPRRLDTQTYGGGTAIAEWDPKAFLYWQPKKLVVAPVMLYRNQKGERSFNGVVLLQTGAKGLTEVGRISVGPNEVANRSFVIGDHVFVLSERALQSHRLDDGGSVQRLKL